MTTDRPDKQSVADHPLVLTTLVLYSIVLGLPLGSFPPVAAPTPADLFIGGVALLLLIRMAMTFCYAATAAVYPERLFSIEVAAAGIFAWQFRVLLDEQVLAFRSPLWMFYALQLALLGTMLAWSRTIQSVEGIRTSRRVHLIRGIGLAAVVYGLAMELSDATTVGRTVERWIVGTVWLVLPIAYAAGRPWKHFGPSSRKAVEPSRPQAPDQLEP